MQLIVSTHDSEHVDSVLEIIAFGMQCNVVYGLRVSGYHERFKHGLPYVAVAVLVKRGKASQGIPATTDTDHADGLKLKLAVSVPR